MSFLLRRITDLWLIPGQLLVRVGKDCLHLFGPVDTGAAFLRVFLSKRIVHLPVFELGLLLLVLYHNGGALFVLIDLLRHFDFP